MDLSRIPVPRLLVAAALCAAAPAAAQTTAPATRPASAETIYQIGSFVVAVKPPVNTTNNTQYPRAFAFSVYQIVPAALATQEASGWFFFKCGSTATSANYGYRDAEGRTINSLDDVDPSFKNQMSALTSTGTMLAHGCGEKPAAYDLTREAAGDPRALARRIRADSVTIDLPLAGPFALEDVEPLMVCADLALWLSEEPGIKESEREWAGRLNDMFFFAFVGMVIQYGPDVGELVEEFWEPSDYLRANATRELNACWNDLNELLDQM